MNVAILHGWRLEGMPGCMEIALTRRADAQTTYFPVGASLLAKNLRTPRGLRPPALSLAAIASKLAPTEIGLYPDGIPQRIIADVFDQPGSQGIGNDVTSHRSQVIFATQRAVEVTLLPYGSRKASLLIDESCTAGFSDLHKFRQITVMQFNQPMDVVRHYDPGQGAGITLFFSSPELAHR